MERSIQCSELPCSDVIFFYLFLWQTCYTSGVCDGWECVHGDGSDLVPLLFSSTITTKCYQQHFLHIKNSNSCPTVFLFGFYSKSRPFFIYAYVTGECYRTVHITAFKRIWQDCFIICSAASNTVCTCRDLLQNNDRPELTLPLFLHWIQHLWSTWW